MKRKALSVLAATALIAGSSAALGGAPAFARTVSCGDTITADTTLHHDLTNCEGNGLVIGADNIRLNLNGHTIDGTVAQTTDCDNAPREPAGIKNGGGDSRVYDRLTIENGTLQQFAQGFDGTAATAPKLIITYTTSGGAATSTPTTTMTA